VTVFRINLAEPIVGAPSRYFAIVDAPHETVDALLADLRLGPLCMDQLETVRHTEPGTFEIVERRRMMITLVGVASIQQPHHRYVEYDDPVDAAERDVQRLIHQPSPALRPIVPVNDEDVLRGRR